MAQPMNREEILYLLRKHVATFAGLLEAQNSVPNRNLWGGTGPEAVGGLKRITELLEALPERPTDNYQGGE